LKSTETVAADDLADTRAEFQQFRLVEEH